MLDLLTISLRWAWVAADATLLLLLLRRSLLRIYPWFAGFLVTELVQMLSGIFLHPGTLLYAKIWAISEIVLLLVAVYAGLEVTRQVLAHYPQIQTLASTTFGMLFCFGVVGAMILAIPFIDGSRWLPMKIYLVMKILRWESFALFLFLFSQLVWFRVFPIHMKPNLVRHRWLLTLYLGLIPALSVTLSDYASSNFYAATWINIGMMVFQLSLVISWCAVLVPGGEQDTFETRASSTSLAIADQAHAYCIEQLRRDLDLNL